MIGRIGRFLSLGLVPNTKLYLTGVPLILLASVSSYVSPNDFELALWYLCANLLALVPVTLVFAGGRWVLRRISRAEQMSAITAGGTSLFALVIFGLVLGVAKQFGTAFSLMALGLADSLGAELLARSLTPLLGVWYVVALASFQAGQARYSQLRKELISERVRRLASKGDGGDELRDFANQAQQLLSNSSSNSHTEIANLIRSIVSEQLRPLSHRLWEREQAKTPGYSGRELAAKALGQRPYRTLPVLLLFSTGSIPPMVSLAGASWWQPFLALFFTTAIALVVSNWIRRRSDWAKRQYLLSLTTSAVGASALSFSVLLAIGYPTSPILWLSSTWWLQTLLVVVGVLLVAQENHERQREMLAELAEGDVADAAAKSVQAIHNRQLANLLHSRMQNKMLAQAMRIETGADLQTELEDLKQMLTELPEASLSAVDLLELKNRWQGILEIIYQCETAPSELVVRICEEAISNAMRHGMATRVEIEFGNGRLRVSDNGLGPVEGTAGLGSALYDSAGEWKLTALDAGGAELQLELKTD